MILGEIRIIERKLKMDIRNVPSKELQETLYEMIVIDFKNEYENANKLTYDAKYEHEDDYNAFLATRFAYYATILLMRLLTLRKTILLL